MQLLVDEFLAEAEVRDLVDSAQTLEVRNKEHVLAMEIWALEKTPQNVPASLYVLKVL